MGKMLDAAKVPVRDEIGKAKYCRVESVAHVPEMGRAYAKKRQAHTTN